MRRMRRTRLSPHIVGWALSIALIAAHVRADDWPAWRGPAGDGVTGDRDLPVKWSTTENVAWKVALPGPGNSTPIIWGERVFLTGATDGGAARGVYCFDRANGQLLWRRDTPFAGKEPTHETNPYASASPTTDGAAVYAWLGSAGVVAHDFDGQQLWQADLGMFEHIWGNAASPVLHGELLILSAGPGPRSMLVALDKRTGTQVWKTELTDARGAKPDVWKGSWSTPVLSTPAGDGAKPQLVLGVPGYVAGFDPSSGKEIWRCRGLTDLVYTNAHVGDGHIVGMSGYGGSAIGLRAPNADERGDLTETHRLWLHEKNPQRIGSGIITGGHLYIINEPGVAQCIELKTGRETWSKRASGATWSSLVLTGGGLLYGLDMTGHAVIFRPTPERFEPLHENDLDGRTTRASIVPSDGQLFIRTYGHLWCIGERRKR